MKQRRITAALLCAILLLSQCNFKIQAASPVTQRQVEAQLAALTEQYEGVAYTDNFNGATQCKGKKIKVFKYRPKKDSKSMRGHRQPYTKVQIEKISV